MIKVSDKEIIEPCNKVCSFCFLNYANVLGKNSLFRNLSTKEVGEIVKKIHHQVKVYQKDEIIASCGDEYNHLLLIVKGAVISEINDFEERVICIDELSAPEAIASSFIFGDSNKLTVNIIAKEETRVLIIQREDLLELFRKNEQIMKNYLDIVANRNQSLSKKIKLLGLQTIKGKIAHYLLDLVQMKGSFEVVLPKTQEELSGLFGVARPSIGRAIREMDADGYISARGKNVKVLNKTALSSLLR